MTADLRSRVVVRLISIHTLAGSVTVDSALERQDGHISIHTLAGSVTIASDAGKLYHNPFQSTHSQGV